jgi:hypothetical protein
VRTAVLRLLLPLRVASIQEISTSVSGIDVDGPEIHDVNTSRESQYSSLQTTIGIILTAVVILILVVHP